MRERVGLMDLTPFAKYEVRGSDAATFLDRVTTGRVPERDGRIALNYVLNENGRIETEVTVTRLDVDRYYLVSGAMGECRDLDWFRHSIGDEETVEVINRSTQVGVIVIAGPRARDVLASCTDTDVSNEEFPFLTAQALTIAGVEVRALRVGFTGALGWELHLPLDEMEPVYDTLWNAGTPHGIADFGSHALNSLRIEKAYLTRHELSHDIGPLQAGVEFFVKRDKGDFVGRVALDRPSSGNPWKLVYLDVDVPDVPGAADCLGGEGVFAGGGEPVGLTTSGGYGFTVERSLAFAYVTAGHDCPGTELGVLVLGELRRATVLGGPVWDPNNEHLRA